MLKSTLFFTVALSLAATSIAHAALFGTLNGLVQDPQGRPVPLADVRVHSPVSGWQEMAQTDVEGRFSLPTVPAGNYLVSVTKTGFQTVRQPVEVRSGAVTEFRVALVLGVITETVEVVSEQGVVNPRSATTQTLVTRDQLESTPGALRANSLDMVTQYVPGATLVHDLLHIRGGHQISWSIDGVPVPNTNISSTVGPQLDPKDVETLEVHRGGYSAEFGDRTYGIFNVVTRSGFERNKEAEVFASYGSFNETNDQFSLGDHTEHFAYYSSFSVNRTDLALATPVPETIHAQGSAVSGFVSLVSKSTATDQFRVSASIRSDRYQIPNTPDQQAEGIDDHQRERDSFVNVSWMRTLGSQAFLTVSPFYHYTQFAYEGGPNDPLVTTDRQASHYAGGQAVLAASKGPHTAKFGVYGFYQHDDDLFALQQGGGGLVLSQTQGVGGNLIAVFVEDQYAATGWLTLNGGLRMTRFSGPLTESAVNPRVGAVVRIPRWAWAVRGSFGQYYQAPPLTTVAGPLFDLAVSEGFGFLPLQGERDNQYEVGVAVPARGWALDVAAFRTNARNFFEHDVIGNSNIFLPLTIDTARIRGLEASVRSPRRQRAQFYLTYSLQHAEGKGAVTGGLTDFSPPEEGHFFLDHDQRHTLAAGLDVALPATTRLSVSFGYGSGFLEGDGPGHLPPHNTVNIQGSKSWGARWALVATVLNVGNTRFLLDESNTFGGTHYNNPRQFSVAGRYRFRY